MGGRQGGELHPGPEIQVARVPRLIQTGNRKRGKLESVSKEGVKHVKAEGNW